MQRCKIRRWMLWLHIWKSRMLMSEGIIIFSVISCYFRERRLMCYCYVPFTCKCLSSLIFISLFIRLTKIFWMMIDGRMINFLIKLIFIYNEISPNPFFFVNDELFFGHTLLSSHSLYLLTTLLSSHSLHLLTTNLIHISQCRVLIYSGCTLLYADCFTIWITFRAFYLLYIWMITSFIIGKCSQFLCTL